VATRVFKEKNQMKTPILYLDTSVIGGYYDEEFMVATRKLFDDIREGRYIALLSELVSAELKEAPEKVRLLADGGGLS
jgi:hypothetical protein